MPNFLKGIMFHLTSLKFALTNFNSIHQILKTSTGIPKKNASDIYSKSRNEITIKENENVLKSKKNLMIFLKSKKLNCI